MIAREAVAGCCAGALNVPMSKAHPVNTLAKQRFMGRVILFWGKKLTKAIRMSDASLLFKIVKKSGIILIYS